MKNFISKYKVKILLTIFGALLLVLLNNNVFASNSAIPSYDTDLLSTIINNLTAVLSEKGLNIDNYDYIVCRNDISYLKVICFEKDNNLKMYIDNYGLGDARVYFNYTINVIWYNIDRNGSLSLYKDNHTMERFVAYSTSSSNFFYSSCNIYSDDNYTNYFFPIAPPEEIPEIQDPGTLQEILEQEKLEMATMKEILGILPLILSVLVSLLGLRKAFQALLNFLKVS